jgi:HEAT repeat protein
MTEPRIGILTTDPALVVTSWDETLASLTGVDGARALGRPLSEVVPDLDSRGLLAIVREPLETGAARVLAAALHGHLIPCPPSSPSPRFDRMQQRVVVGALRQETKTVGLVITVEDVTDRLDREHELALQLRSGNPDARLRAVERLSAVDPVDGLGPLPHAMGDDDWHVRRSAVQTLAGRRDPSLVEALVKALRESHRDFSVLSSALQLLTITGVDLTTALVELLRNPDADLRIQAALALGTQQRPEAVDALLTALDDPDANVRFHAIEALGKLGPPAAVEPLAALAESDDFFLSFPALDALARINDPAVAPRIVPLLQHELVGDQAAEALGQIGDEEVVGPLVAALDRADRSPASIVDALAAIHRRYRDMFDGAAQIEDLVRRSISPAAAARIIDAAATSTGASLRQFVVVLGWLRGAAVERALTHMLGNPAVQHELVEAIIRFGTPMVDVLVEQLHREDGDTRRAAIIALGHIGDVRAVPALLERLDGGDRDLQVAVCGALARLGDRRAFEPLLRLLGDGDVSVRHATIGALNSIGHPDMAARVLVLMNDADATVRESAVKIAGYFGYAACAEQLLARCHDQDEAVRAAALEHAVFLDDDRAAPLLMSAVVHDTPRVRAAAAQALAHVDAADATDALLRAADDPDAWVRYFSATSLGRRAAASAVPVLGRLASSDQRQHVRIAAVDALGAIGALAPDVAAGVLATFSTSEDSDVSVAAIRALGSVRSAAAHDPLRRALSASDPVRRAAAADAIARWAGDQAVALLRWSAAADAEPTVVQAAIDGLLRLGNGPAPAAEEAVGALAEVASDPVRRNAAIGALARVSPAAIPWVGECLSSRDPHLRRAVVEALGRLSHPTASAYVRRALEDGDDSVRQVAVMVLSGLGTRGMARSFAELARTDPSERVRRAADAALRRGSDQTEAAER